MAQRVHALRAWLHAARTDERGGIAMLVAVAGMILIAFTALAVDVPMLYVTHARLQAAADIAALAGVVELPDEAAARAAAIDYAGKNMAVDAHGTVLAETDVAAGSWDAASRTFTPGGTPRDALSVTTRRAALNGNPVPTFLAHALGFGEMDVIARSIAGKGAEPICLLALSPDAAKAIEVSGGGDIVASGCEIHVHSTDSKATNLSGGSTMTTIRTCIAGGYGGSGYSPTPETGCSPAADPLAGTPPPAFGSCDFTNTSFSGGTRTLTPGVYCGGISMSSGGTLLFEPGIYIIKDGGLLTSGGATVQGAGVGFYLTGSNVKVDFSGGAEVDLSAPTTGRMAGLIFYQNPASNPGANNHFSGGANSSYEGALYFPTQHITISGGGIAAFPPPHSTFIAQTFTFSGGSDLYLGSNYAASDVPRPAGLGGHGARLLR
jgi:Flp pilus assembly protein TadG